METLVKPTKEELLSKFLFDKMQLGYFTNEDLVQFIEPACGFLNLNKKDT